MDPRRLSDRKVGAAGRLGLVLLAGALVGARSVPAPTSDPSDPPHRRGEVLVGFRAETPGVERERVLAELGATVERRKPGVTGVAHVRLRDGDVARAVARYRDDPRIEFIEPDYLWFAQRTPNDPDFPEQWGLANFGQTAGTPGADVSALSVWDVTTGSRSVIVAILDTGVDTAHPDLAANVYVNPGELPGNALDDDGNGYVDDVHGWDFANDDAAPLDDHGHGTHVAGIAGAVGDNGVGVAGMSWQLSLLPLKFLDSNGIGSTSAAIRAIEYASAMGARIINASWGGYGFSQGLRLAIERAEAAGVLFVAAAGNSNPGRNIDLLPFYPASYDVESIVSVAATDDRDQLASFSNFGAQNADLAAPGVDIYSTYPDDDYAYVNGTSMATPLVSGSLALLMARFPEIGAIDAKQLLLSHVDPVDALQGLVATGGRLNAYRPLADPDDVAPDPIGDLATVEPESSRIDLVWTATGDDRSEGRASRYDVRYATTPLDAASFAAATRVPGAPLPAPAGTSERMRVSGLAAGTTYHFAVRALDEFGNASPVSNSAAGTTLGPPELEIEPLLFEADLFTGQAVERTMTLLNHGAGELLFDVSIGPHRSVAPQADPGASARAPPSAALDPAARADRAVELALDAESALATRPWEWGPAGSGMKEVTSATAANGTRYSYHEWDAPGGHFTGIYRQFDELTPGYVSFWVRPSSTLADAAYFVLRDRKGAEAIFFFASSGGTFYVNADVGGDASVPYQAHVWHHVEFRNFDFTAGTFDYWVDGLVRRTGVPLRASNVRGVARIDLYNFEPGSEAWWDEIVVTTDNPPQPVHVEPRVGVVPAGGSGTLTVTLDATRLHAGHYEAPILVRSNDPHRPAVQVLARLHVSGAPDIELSTSRLDFGPLLLGASATLPLTVWNIGTDTLRVSALESDSPAFEALATAFTLLPGEGRDVSVVFHPQVAGFAAGTLTLRSDDPDLPAALVDLAGEGRFPPDIRIEPAQVLAALHTGQHAALGLEITNTGLSELDWELAFPSAGEPALEAVLAALEQEFGTVLETIPERYEFAGGARGTHIEDGGADMYDGGNVLGTDYGFVAYTDGAISNVPQFGPGSRYFTRKYPGLFVLVADLAGATRFSVSGKLGGNGTGVTEGAIVRSRMNGFGYVGFAKRVHGAQRPSVNHLIALVERPNLDHRFATYPGNDGHEVLNLESSSRLYYLLFAGRDGFRYDDERLETVLHAFLRTLPFAPDWLRAEPRAGVLAPGHHAALEMSFDAFGLDGGAYRSDLRVLSNVPGREESVVPVILEVTAAPDVDVPTSALSYGGVFLGATVSRIVRIHNRGSAPLVFDLIAVDPAAYTASVSVLEVAARSSQDVTVTFSPTALGPISGTLRLRGNDPDEPDVLVSLNGRGVAPPVLGLRPPAIDEVLEGGREKATTLFVDNHGLAPLSFLIRVNGAGANAVEAAGPGTLAARPQPTDLRPNEAPPANDPQPIEPDHGPAAPAPRITLVEDFEDGDLDGWLGVNSALATGAEAETVFPPEPASVAAPEGAVPGGPTTAAPAAYPPPSAAAIFPIRLSPSSGSVPPGASVPIEVTLDASGLVEGEHEYVLEVETNDPLAARTVVPVRITVVGVALIGVSVRDLDFGSVPLGLAAERTLTVTNFGSAALDVSAIEIAHPDFTANASAFVLAPAASRGVTVTYRPAVAGSLRASLTILSNSPDSPLSIELAGEGRSVPLIAVAPGEIALSQPAGTLRTTEIQVENRGTEPLTFAAAIAPAAGEIAPEEVLSLSDDMEAGAAGWVPEVYAGMDLWHRSSRSFHSPGTAWSCSVEGRSDYATGGRVSTALVSPPIDLRGLTSPAWLTFRESYRTEPVWDQCMVDASVDGGTTWIPLRGAYGKAPSGNSNGWRLTTIDVGAFAGQLVRFRFYFETFDGANNNQPGWFVDDVAVRARHAPWVALAPASGLVEPGGERRVALTFDARALRPPGTYRALVRLTSNDPVRPAADLPVNLDVVPSPRIVLRGGPVVAESVASFSTAGARTLHSFAVAGPPGGPLSVTLGVEGVFSSPRAMATLTLEGFVLGTTGGDAEPCSLTARSFVLPWDEFTRAAADGTLDFEVRNAAAVGASCPRNRHELRLGWAEAEETIDLGEVPIGTARTSILIVSNEGHAALDVTSIASDDGRVLVDPPSLHLAPAESAEVELSFRPPAAGPFETLLRLVSNDPTRPVATARLVGTGVAAPVEIALAPAALVAALPPGALVTKTRTLRLANDGAGTLVWSIERSTDWVAVTPAAGSVEAHASIDVVVELSSAALGTGVHETALVVRSNDPLRPRLELPITLRVGWTELTLLEVRLAPKHATRPGTVEAVLQLPAGFSPSEVALDTVALAGVPPEASPVAVLDANHDGTPEQLVLQFDAVALAAALPPGDVVPVALEGEVRDRTWFRGSTWIRGIAVIPR